MNFKNYITNAAAIAALLFVVPQVVAQDHCNVGDFENPSEDYMFDGGNFQNLPMAPVYHNSTSQVIYRADEISDMTNSTIESISYAVNTDNYMYSWEGGGGNYTFRVYLQEIDEDDFRKGDSDNPTTWFATDLTSPQAELELPINWDDIYDTSDYGEPYIITIDMSSNPFTYTGKNLLVTLVVEGDGYVGGSEICFYQYDPATVAMRGIIAGTDNDSHWADIETAITEGSKLEHGESRTEYPLTQFAYTKKAATGNEVLQTGSDVLVWSSNGKINLKSTTAISTVEIVNVHGQIVAASNPSAAQVSINNNLSKGLYLVRSTDENGAVRVHKLMID